jgi:membrane protein implicated in regulation of membrane protease activity
MAEGAEQALFSRGGSMPTMFWIWMALAAIFLIVELSSPSFFFISFVIGSLAAGIYTLTSPDAVYWQIGIFLVLSAVLLPAMRTLARRITKDSPQLSNVDRMIGQQALVIQAIDPDEAGKVRFEGEIWNAVAEEAIAEGGHVLIESVAGVTLHVTRKA